MASLERFVGYGSLMSAEGLGPQLEHVLDAEPIRLEASRRFAKPSQRGGCLAMDVVIQEATVAAAPSSAADPAPPAGHCEGLLISVRAEGQAGLVRREGYSPTCWERVRSAAGAKGPAAFLLDLAQSVAHDVLAYRQALHEVAGPSSYTASHYVPHPVRTPAGPAVIFVAPAPGASGIPGVDSAKAAYPRLTPQSVDTVFALSEETYPGFDPERQRWYLELCLRAAAHGIWVGDLIPSAPAHPVAPVLASWRADPAPLAAERERLALLPGLSASAERARRFGASLQDALARSGLKR